MGGNWTERERQQWQRRAERDREARGNRNIKHRACETSRLCIQRITEVEVFVPGGDFSPNQMHKDSVMGCRSFAVSLASDGPIPLDSQPGSVLGEEHLVYRDVQISEIFEVVMDRALHILLDHMT